MTLSMISRTALLLAPFALSACADGAIYDLTDNPPGRDDLPPVVTGPEMTRELDRNTTDAMPFIEQVASQCWLDGVVQADAMLVDRMSGRIVMTKETTDVLVVDFLPALADEALAQIRLSGPVLVNEPKTKAMMEHLTRAERTGEVACPPLDAPGRDTPIISAGG
ncbi:MAG: hypothetical protein AAF698_06505 [Pseudomonadota bacterium]